MKKCLFLVYVAALMSLMHVHCLDISPDFTGIYDIPDFPLHLRNTCTTSGVDFVYEKWYVLGYLVQGPEWASVHLDESPGPGLPVDKTVTVQKQTSDWYVQREIDSVVIGSGSVHFDREKWLLIDGSRCIWSDEPWE